MNLSTVSPGDCVHLHKFFAINILSTLHRSIQ